MQRFIIMRPDLELILCLCKFADPIAANNKDLCWPIENPCRPNFIIVLCRPNYRAMVPWTPLREGGREGDDGDGDSDGGVDFYARCCLRRDGTGHFWCASLKAIQATTYSPFAVKTR